MKLHHVQVSCPPEGEDAARRFYRDALGLVEVAKPPALAVRGGVWFRSADLTPDTAPDAAPDAAPSAAPDGAVDANIGAAADAPGPVAASAGGPGSGGSVRAGVWDVELHVGVEKEFRPATKAHPAFVVDDIDELAARLRAHGYATEWDDLFPGYRRLYTADGNGNRVEILQPSPAT